MENDDLTYSTDALLSRVILSVDQNDINIIVEDKNKEYIYETIFSRMCDYKIGIFAVGGKSAVKKAHHEFKSHNIEGSSIKYLYLLDGDFDRYIYEEDMINDNYCIYLESYNLENYFIDEKATKNFVKGKLKCRDKDLDEKFNFNKWKNKIVSQASELFLLYCYIKKYHPEIPSVSREHSEFIDFKTGFKRKDFFFNTHRFSFMNDENLKGKINELKNKYKSVNGTNYFNLICGKFLLTSLRCYINSITKKTIKPPDFEWHLINNFDISKLYYLKIAIENRIKL